MFQNILNETLIIMLPNTNTWWLSQVICYYYQHMT